MGGGGGGGGSQIVTSVILNRGAAQSKCGSQCH